MRSLLCLAACLALAHAGDPLTFFGGADYAEYKNWLDANGDKFHGHAFYPKPGMEDHGASLHWKIEGDYLHVAMAAKATGWIAMGFSENGGMAGADIVSYEAATDVLTDGHILEEFIPLVDECENYELLDATVGEVFMIVEFQRLVDTGDMQDRALIDDSGLDVAVSRVIFAWGDTPSMQYHVKNRSKGGVRFYGAGVDEQSAFRSTMEENAEGIFELRSKDHVIQLTTNYIQLCLTWDDIVAQGVPADVPISVISFEPIVENVGALHHFHVGGSNSLMNGKTCDEFTEVTHSEMAYGWAHGEPPLILPNDVGLFVGPGYMQSFRMEIHYENPQQVEGIFDNSGLRFHYTTKMRPLEFSVLRLGDVNVALENQSTGRGLTEHMFHCPESCSNTVMKEDITVIREYLHMHSTGVSARNDLIRDSEVVHTGLVDFFDFDQQGNHAAQQEPFTVRKGDAFNTSCTYRNDGDRKFGFGGEDEMCVIFLSYYPKQTYLNGVAPFICSYEIGFNPCEAEYTKKEDMPSVPRLFGESSCGPPVEDTNGGTSGSTLMDVSAEFGALFLA